MRTTKITHTLIYMTLIQNILCIIGISGTCFGLCCACSQGDPRREDSDG